MKMNPNRIEEGDIVNVVWNNGEVHRNVEVLHTPMATGDMWVIRNYKGEIIYVNSNSSDLSVIVLIHKAEQQEV